MIRERYTSERLLEQFEADKVVWSGLRGVSTKGLGRTIVLADTALTSKMELHTPEFSKTTNYSLESILPKMGRRSTRGSSAITASRERVASRRWDSTSTRDSSITTLRMAMDASCSTMATSLRGSS